MIKSIILSSVVTAAVGAAGYGAWEGMVMAADQRYVRQDAWIADNKNREIREHKYKIDEIEFQKTQRPLDPKETWELQRLKSEIELIRGGK